MKQDIEGCKLVISDKISKSEILNAISLMLTNLEEQQGIQAFSNINICFDVHKAEEKEVLGTSDNSFNEFPYKPNSEIINKIIGNNAKNLIPEKDYLFDKITQGINNIKAKTGNRTTAIQTSRSNFKDDVAQKVRQLQAAEEMVLQQSLANLEEKKNVMEREILSAFKKMIADKFQIQVSELPTVATGIGYITEERLILKHLSKNKIPKEGKVLRVTFRDKFTNKASHSEIYDLNLNLIQ